MSDTLSSFLKTKALLGSAVSLKLLRARNLPLIITFLNREFKAGEQMAIPYLHLIQKLGNYLEEVEYTEVDDELQGSRRLVLEYDEKGKLYIDRWNEAHYLRIVVDDTTKEPLVLLSKHTEKVFQVFELLRDKEFVGAESKFKDIFHKLRDIVQHANPDKEKRLAELEHQKQKIDEEIRRIKVDGYVSTYEDYQIKSRFEEVSRLATELIGDFREVEDNFKLITRRIYERQQQADLSKGKLLSETFDALYELKKTDQGKSFYAFWQFMLDDASQEEFQRLSREVHQVLEDREIEISARSLKKFKRLLHLAARKVLEKNGLLADKLSREIMAKDQLESRKTRELMASIRQLALQRLTKSLETPTGKGSPLSMKMNGSDAFSEDKEVYITLEGVPAIYLPLERKLGDRPELNTFAAKAVQARVDPEDLAGLVKLYSSELVDKKVLLANVQELLQNRPQVSLKEVVEAKGLTKGLAELLAYVSLLNTSAKFHVNEQARELILFDAAGHKYLELPQLIFTK